MDVWDEDWRLGRLAEDSAGAELQALKGRMFGSVPKRGYAAPAHRSSRPASADGRSVFYVRVESRRKGDRGDRTAALQEARARHQGRREYVFPSRGEAAKARAAGARWDRQVGALYMAASEAPAHWTDGTGERQWCARQSRIAGRSGEGLACAHLRYVERNGDAESEDIAEDEDGPLIVLNVGATLEERAAFWDEYESKVVANGQISHLRLVAELPAQLDAAEQRQIVVRMSAEFDRRGLPHVAVVHKPSPTSDARNIHVHWLIGDRPGTVDKGVWRFVARKDRDLRGPTFVAWLRELHADAANGALAQREASAAVGKSATVRSGSDAAAPVQPVQATRSQWRRWYPGTYVDLGIARTSQLHLGPHNAALERAGIPTWKGAYNGAMEARYRALEAAAHDLSFIEQRNRVATRVSSALAASLGDGATPTEKESVWAVRGAGAALDREIQSVRQAAARCMAEEETWWADMRPRRRLAWAQSRLEDHVRRRRDRGHGAPVSPQESVLQAIVAEARANLGTASLASAGDAHQEIGEAAPVRNAQTILHAASARAAAARRLFEVALERFDEERLVGAFVRADRSCRNLDKLPVLRAELVRANSAAAEMGLRLERLAHLDGAASGDIMRGAGARATPDQVRAATKRLRQAGVAVAEGDDPASLVRSFAALLRLEKTVTRLEAERARAKRSDPLAERERAEAAIRANAAALSLAVGRGLISATAATREPIRSQQNSTRSGMEM
ncbi:MAG: hypothetical protein ACLGJC_17010 [Alphaproteobacteria bacterium]